jgi:hypothetical protein
VVAAPKRDPQDQIERLSEDVADRVLDFTRRLIGKPTSAAALYADVMPEDETPDMLNEAVERWRRGERA